MAKTGRPGKTVTIYGVTYASRTAAAVALGVSVSAICHRERAGTLAEYRGRGRTRGDSPFALDGISGTVHEHAARLGCTLQHVYYRRRKATP